MALDGMKLDFESDDQLPEQEYERKRIPPKTKAQVKVRPDREGNLGDFRHGESQYGPWMIIPFEVVDGDYAGEWASMIINLKTNDRRFRKVFEVVTGIDVSEGGSVGFEDFKAKLVSGVFEAELGPETKKNSDGEPEETGYTKVFRLDERVADRDGAVASASDAEAPAFEDDLEDEDTPF
jgi:hypothetical protein